VARPQSWSVKGVDQETRALAREAAARSEQPIGAWIDRAIRTRTGLPPDSEPEARDQDALPGLDATAGDKPAPAIPAGAASARPAPPPPYRPARRRPGRRRRPVAAAPGMPSAPCSSLP